MKYTCIYCRTEKDENEFNREHVVPRMMGTYQQGLVLSDHQVCQACNSYFSKEIEDKIALDSYEAFLRMRYGTKTMTDGRKVRHNRLSLHGAEGIFKGLEFTAVADSKSPERVHFEISPCIGLRISEDEYEYFSPDNLPMASEVKLKALKGFSNPIVHFGLDSSVARDLLKKKGYISSDAQHIELSLTDVYSEPDFMTSINFKVDSFVRRVCAKTIFNYMCSLYGADHMLDKKYDKIREYIRYGTWDDSLWFRYSTGFVTAITPPNKTAHAIGTLISFQNGTPELVGCVTWFGELTCLFKICDITPQGITPVGTQTVATLPIVDTRFSLFNNETAEITEDNSLFILQ